jgi:hypothetical protein
MGSTTSRTDEEKISRRKEQERKMNKSLTSKTEEERRVRGR